jgi:pimeloyl-ACP methyl ester carboxylesterase
MKQVQSHDGTPISYWTQGNGPPLIIVGGALGDHRFYAPLAAELAKEFTVFTFDRRGRGQSGDRLPYAIEREIEDVAAILGEAGEAALVYGHSAGSMLALHAAAAGLGFSKLVLADPPVRAHGDADEAARARQAESAATIQALHDRGDHRGAAAFFLSGFGLPAEVVQDMLDSPAGEAMIDCARALPYDFALVGDGFVPETVAARISVPTLIVAAEPTPPGALALAQATPTATLQPLRTSTHDLAPAEIAQAISPFLRSALAPALAEDEAALTSQTRPVLHVRASGSSRLE